MVSSGITVTDAPICSRDSSTRVAVTTTGSARRTSVGSSAAAPLASHPSTAIPTVQPRSTRVITHSPSAKGC